MFSSHWFGVGIICLSTPGWCSQNSTQNSTAFALVYGYPLAPYLDLAAALDQQSSSGSFLANTFYHQTALANSSARFIVMPNSDTLYSEALIDLSATDLVITVPEIEDRFFVAAFYDLYGNNFANIGTVNQNPPGRYHVRYKASGGLEPGDDNYAGYVNMPTTYGTINIRILVKNNSDAANVVALGMEFALSPAKRTAPFPFPNAPALTPELLTSGLNGNSTEQLLQLTARLAPYNPPEVAADASWVSATLARAGMANGIYSQPDDVDLGAAALEANTTINSAPFLPGAAVKLTNSWAEISPNHSGDFKSHYDMRAFVAETGYQQLTPDQAIYPIYTGDKPLYANQSYIVTFSGKPPVKPEGFWSLTAYADLFLIPNPLGRYSLGDRSALTFPDGSLVYGTNSTRDGTFQILLQTGDIAPPSNWTSNWLPTPFGNGEFTITLRWYVPSEELIPPNATYVYPLIEESETISA